MNKDKCMAHGCRIGNVLVLIKGVQLKGIRFHKHKQNVTNDSSAQWFFWPWMHKEQWI